MEKILRSRFGGIALLYLLILVVALVTRCALFAHSFKSVNHGLLALAGTFLCGGLYDLAAAAYASIPLMIYLMLAPRHWLANRYHRGLIMVGGAVVLYLLLFGAIAEWFFWDEFSARFNFIAVDYLIYTREVIGNIRESYPLPVILGGLALFTGIVGYGIWRTRLLQTWFEFAPLGRRFWPGVVWLSVPLTFQLALSNQSVPEFNNAYNQELARNGLYSFFSAYWENSLNYDRFYATLPEDQAFRELRQLLKPDQGAFKSDDLKDITRSLTNAGPEKHWNVIQITVESLSASFLGAYGNRQGLTPNLDRLMTESLTFTNFYATGNRTVRGMEALTLSLPPTPGQSIVRRPHNEKLFSTGALFRSRGYDTAFIYSGHGYFDNMNAFFAANGYRIIDRASVRKEDITYATIWGACDGDLYRWTMREADNAFAQGKPFHHFVMTTSNHRPYGFPAGCIDLPTGRREGAVKYTDYAIGKFLADARSHAWFTNTLFVIVADHCASSAGKTSLPVNGYRIPVLIWNPTLVTPLQADLLCSQIDLSPTIFGLLGWNYESRFYGWDLLQPPPAEGRAFIATYQKLGYMRDGKLAILEPVCRRRVLNYTQPGEPSANSPEDQKIINEAIVTYQTASHLFSRGLNHEGLKH